MSAPKQRSRAWLALAAAAPLVALTACGGGGTTSDADGKLTVWAWDPAFNVYAMNEAARIYQADHPEVEIDVVETPWDDIQTKLTTLAQSGQTDQLPDIFLMQNNAFQKNVINYPDLFSDYAGAGVDFTQFPQAVVDYSVVDGVNYGMPFDNGTAVTGLRTDVIEQAGYTVDDFTDITWDEYIARGQDVLAATGKPLLSGVAGESDTIMMMLQSAGASLFDDDGNPTLAGNDALLAAIETYEKLVESGVMVERNSWDEYIATFVNDEVAGVVNGVWILGSVQTAQDQAGNWAITNVPRLDGVGGATNYTANGGSSWAVSSNADRDLAIDFLNTTFGGSTELYDTILPSSGALANWTPAGDSAVYAQPQEFFGGDAIYAKVVDFATHVPSNNTGAYYYEGRDAVSTAITKILQGTDTASALEEAQATVEFDMQ